MRVRCHVKINTKDYVAEKPEFITLAIFYKGNKCRKENNVKYIQQYRNKLSKNEGKTARFERRIQRNFQ